MYSTTPSSRRTSNTPSLRRISSSRINVDSNHLTYQTIIHASIKGRTMGCQVATTVSFNNTTASQKTIRPSVVTVPCIEDDSSDAGSSGCSTCSCNDCRDASTGTLTPSTVTKSPPRQTTRRTSSTRNATRSAASALPPTSKLLSPSSRRISSSRPSSVPPPVVRPPSAPVQSKRSSITPPLERYLSDVSSPSDTNSLRSQQGSVASHLVPLRRPTSAPKTSSKAARRPSSSDVSPSTMLRYGEFHPIRDSSMWKNKKTSQHPTTPKKNFSSPRHNVIKSKNTLVSPNLCFESCQGSTAVGLSATSASTAMMAKFPAWQHEQQRQHQGPTPIMTEALHTSAWGHIRVTSPEKPNVRGGSSKGRRAQTPHPSEPSVVDLECGNSPYSVVKESTAEALGETTNSIKILGLDSCATKLRFVLIIVVTFLLLLASLALYYDLNVAKKDAV